MARGDLTDEEIRDRLLEQGSHPSTWDPPRPCPLCKVKPKLWKGEYLCACMLPVGVER